jgi:hypothetical protein
MLLKQISHFFEHYKDLEANKWVKLDGWADVDAAKQEINDSVKRFNQLKNQIFKKKSTSFFIVYWFNSRIFFGTIASFCFKIPRVHGKLYLRRQDT